MAFTNPILEKNYKGVVIRKYNKVQLRVSAFQYKQFIDAKKDFGLSAIEAIQQKKALCNICNQANFIIAKNI